jgi:hypothetical protein
MFPHERERNAMAAKMATDRAQEIYKLQQQIIEPVFGDIKETKGMRGFLTRGIKTVKGEFNLFCAAVNIKRIWARMKDKNGNPDGLYLLCCKLRHVHRINNVFSVENPAQQYIMLCKMRQ